MFGFLFIIAAIIAALWAYVKFFGKPCGCEDK